MKESRTGFGRSNASRGRESLKALHSRVWKARSSRFPLPHTLKGHQTSREAAVRSYRTARLSIRARRRFHPGKTLEQSQVQGRIRVEDQPFATRPVH